ncbi:MAG TPA: hypothetical protein VGF69_04495 [Thermoanaerobaculia bacterium]|jgi:hypothetical protein
MTPLENAVHFAQDLPGLRALLASPVLSAEESFVRTAIRDVVSELAVHFELLAQASTHPESRVYTHLADRAHELAATQIAHA